ncbi:MAG: hypothetical protein AAF845_00270 [Bacteroidota bacterium]
MSHKTLPQPFGSMEEYEQISVSWEEFHGVLDRLVAAFCDAECGVRER